MGVLAENWETLASGQSVTPSKFTPCSLQPSTWWGAPTLPLVARDRPSARATGRAWGLAEALHAPCDLRHHAGSAKASMPELHLHFPNLIPGPPLALTQSHTGKEVLGNVPYLREERQCHVKTTSVLES